MSTILYFYDYYISGQTASTAAAVLISLATTRLTMASCISALIQSLILFCWLDEQEFRSDISATTFQSRYRGMYKII